MNRASPYTPTEAKERIREILRDGEVQPTRHCRCERMPERGVQMSDIFRVLGQGEIRRAAEWDEQHAQWKYRVEGEDVEGDELIAVTVILAVEMRLLIVTVF